MLTNGSARGGRVAPKRPVSVSSRARPLAKFRQRATERTHRAASERTWSIEPRAQRADALPDQGPHEHDQRHSEYDHKQGERST